MTPVPLPFQQLQELEVQALHQGSSLLVNIAGTADMRVSSKLSELLAALHDEALRRAVDRVSVDMTRLEFMNSSCFKSFVTWVARLQATDTEKQYRVIFKSDPQILWQRRSLHALRYFAMELISVEAIAS